MGRTFEQFRAGEVFLTPRRTITEADIGAFAGLTGDYNPLHTDEIYASATAFGGRVAHGPMLIGIAFGLMSRLDLLDGTALGLLGLDWTFKQPVRPSDAVLARVEVLDVVPGKSGDRGVVSLKIALLNQSDDLVQQGHAKVLVRGAGSATQIREVQI